MRPILANLIITSFPSNSFPSSTPPLNTPGSSPLLRPISSPMTPITPLVLTDSTTAGSGAHYEKENFFSHEAGYFFHGHNGEELYTTSPYYYAEQYYNDRNTATQPQVTVNVNGPSPANTNSFNIFNPNSVQTVNHYANHPYNQNVHHHQMMSSYNNHTAPSHISGYDRNVNSPYDTLENHYDHDAKIQNQDDAQFHEIITGLNKMDIMDSH